MKLYKVRGKENKAKMVDVLIILNIYLKVKEKVNGHLNQKLIYVV